MRILPCADAGILVELANLDEVLALYEVLAADPPAGVTEIVPAARTILLRLDPDRANPDAVAGAVRTTTPGSVRQRTSSAEVRVPVSYTGADLADVATHTGLTQRELVAAHTAAIWTVAFCGFAPGFGYLVCDDPRLVVPRRGEARTAIPAGSVALAGEFSGIYPRQSPGGWQLIGRTDVVTWDINRDPPGLLQPGTRVRFEEVT